MEDNDIGVTVHQHIACHFEGLLMTVQPVPEETIKRHWWHRPPKIEEPVVDDGWVTAIARRWRPNELPLKSVIHMTTKLGVGVEVYTYYDPIFVPVIEHWLARKGAHVNVHSYDGPEHLIEDLKYNRDVHTYFTPYENDAALIGWHRATVVLPDGTFGF